MRQYMSHRRWLCDKANQAHPPAAPAALERKHKPCLLMRESTERQEGLDGCCLLSRFEQEKIDAFLNDPARWRRNPAPASESPSRNILDAIST